MIERQAQLDSIAPIAGLEPSLCGHWVELEPLVPEHYEFVLRASYAGGNLVRWRFRGRTVSPEDFVRALWSGVLTQFVVVRRRDRMSLGLVSAYNADLRNGFAYVSVLLDPRAQRRGWPLEGLALFIDLLFATEPIRKLYFETSEPLSRERLLSGLVHEEGRLQDHERWPDGYRDMKVLAVYRGDWLTHRPRLLPDVPREDGATAAP